MNAFDLIDLSIAYSVGSLATLAYLFISWRKWREAGISAALLIIDVLFFAYRHFI